MKEFKNFKKILIKICNQYQLTDYIQKSIEDIPIREVNLKLNQYKSRQIFKG